MTDNIYHYDVIVIGAGHALELKPQQRLLRLGAKTALLTNNLDTVGQMSCNPNRELQRTDRSRSRCLGGLMGHAIDATGIQFRLLNRRKGQPCTAPEQKADKKAYQNYVKYRADPRSPRPSAGDRRRPHGDRKRNLSIGSEGCVSGGAEYRADNVVLTTGTFLQAIMHTGS